MVNHDGRVVTFPNYEIEEDIEYQPEPEIEEENEPDIEEDYGPKYSGTPVRKIYNQFLSLLISDVFAKLETEAPKVSEKIMADLLEGAVWRFDDYARQSLEFNKTNFEENLERKAQGVLARLMLTEWLNQKLMTEEYMAPTIGDRDFNMSDTWRIIRVLTPIWEKMEKESLVMMKNYTWREFKRNGGW